MSRTIYKYPLSLGEQPIKVLVKGATGPKPVLVAMQGGVPTIWHEVDTENPVHASFAYIVVGTGHDIPEKSEHIGSVIDGIYVWHVYEIFD